MSITRMKYSVEQNTPGWMALRSACLCTASELHDLLYNPAALFDRKTRANAAFEGSHWTSRGHDMEPVVRNWTNDLMPEQRYAPGAFHTLKFKDLVLGASPDAEGVDTLLEIKCRFDTGKERKVVNAVDPKHYAQLAGQALVCDKEHVLYACWDEMDADSLYLSWFSVPNRDAFFAKLVRPALSSFALALRTGVRPKPYSTNEKLLTSTALMKMIKTNYL